MKKIHKLSAMFLTLCMIFLCSCSQSRDYCIYAQDKNGKATVGMTEGMYNFFFSQKKTEYLTVLKYNDNTITEDSPEIWDRVGDNGKTYGETFEDQILEDAKYTVAASHILYDVYEYKLPDAYTDYVNKLILNNAVTGYGSKDEFSAYLSNFGTSYKEYCDLYYMTANVDLLKELLYNKDSGAVKFTDEEKRSFFAENFYTVNHIYINTTYDAKADGTKYAVTEEQKAQREGTANEIFARLKAGESFEDIKNEYKDNAFVSVYTDKTFVNKNGSTALSQLGDTIKTMTPGEMKMCNTAVGTHILLRLETLPDDYNTDENLDSSIISGLANEDFKKLIEKYKDEIKVNSDFTNGLNIANAPIS